MQSTSTSRWSVPRFQRRSAARRISPPLGTAVAALALPLVAALALEASALEMGVLVAIERGPIFIFGLVPGIWIDPRLGRPRMIATDIARAAALLVGPVAARLGRVTIETVYAVAFVVGSLSVLFELASLAYLPSLVGRAQVFDGNSKLFLSEGFTGIAGRSLAGVLVRIAGAPVALLVDRCSSLLSAACLAAIRSPEPPPRPFTGTSLRTAIGEGLRFVFGNPILRITRICNGLWNVWYYARVAVLVLFLTEEGGLGPAVIGLGLAAGSAGFLVAAALSPALNQRWGPGRSMLWGAVLVLIGAWMMVTIAPGRSAPAVLVLASYVMELGGGVFAVIQRRPRQVITRRTSRPG